MRIHTVTAGPFATNTYIVANKEATHALLVDPTIDCAEKVRSILTKENLRVMAIINTHGHIDHIFGNGVVKEITHAPLYIHRLDVPWLEHAPESAEAFGLPPITSPLPDGYLEDGQTIAVPGLSFLVIHTPGHTPGSICLYGQGILLAGDTLFAGSVGRTDLPGGDWQTLVRSIQTRLWTLPGETVVYSGHGPTTTIGQEKMGNPFVGTRAHTDDG